jgi:ATP-dependent Lon protease
MKKFQKLEQFAQEGKDAIDIPDQLPIIPMRTNMLVYPGSVIPFYVGRDKSLNALEESIEKKNRLIFLVSQKNLELEEPTKEDLFEMGVVTQVMQLMKLPDGTFKVLVEGLVRARKISYLEGEKFDSAVIKIVVSEYKVTKALEAMVRKVKEDTQKYFNMTKKLPPEALQALEDTSDTDRFADFVSSILPLPLEDKQRLLEAEEPKRRLESLMEYLTKEIDLLKMEEDLERKVRFKLEQNQKEYYLREKMRTIKEELDGSEDQEIVELRDKVEKGGYPAFVMEKALHEIERLEKSPAYSAESTVIRTYLDWLLGLPWNEETIDEIDIKRARKILDKDHFGLEEVKERILEFLAARAFSKSLKAPILCLVGPPGVGKTSLGQSLARAMGRKFVRMSLGGMRDEAEIRGHRRTYVGALPGRIIQLLKNSGVKNPVILLDELDKMGQSFQGDPASALLEVLDPEQNANFVDHFVEVPFDLSKVIFITTANVLYTLPPALKDRLEVIEIPGYTEQEKIKIAQNYLVPKILSEHNMEGKVQILPQSIRTIIGSFTREAGVRNLNRELSGLVRKSALKMLENKLENYRIDKKAVFQMLGAEKYFEDQRLEKPYVGICTGMAWTAVGGSVLQIESLFVQGSGKLILTGQLGDIMKESAQIALSVARNYCGGDSRDYFEKHDLHVHVPEGAVPKDGPSAGITLAVSIASSILKKPVKNLVAMTGELTLRGKVLPVGGIREKVLAAYRTGIKTIVLPKQNQKDTEKIPQEVMDDIRIHFVNTIEEVFKAVMIDPEPINPEKPGA